MAGVLEVSDPFARVLAPGERLLWSGAPSAGGQLRASLGGILGSLFFGGLAGAGFLYALLTRTETGFAACGTFFAVGLFSLWQNLRTGFGARHLHYAISQDRILSIDDRKPEPFVVYRSYPGDSMRTAWLEGLAKRGWRLGGRATVKIPYKSFQLGTGRLPDGWRKDWLRFVAVERPDEAVALLNGRREE